MRFLAVLLAISLSSFAVAAPKQTIELDPAKILTLASIGQEEPPPALQPAPPKKFIQTPAGKITLVSGALVVVAVATYGALVLRAQAAGCSESPTDISCRNNGIGNVSKE